MPFAARLHRRIPEAVNRLGLTDRAVAGVRGRTNYNGRQTDEELECGQFISHRSIGKSFSKAQTAAVSALELRLDASLRFCACACVIMRERRMFRSRPKKIKLLRRLSLLRSAGFPKPSDIVLLHHDGVNSSKYGSGRRRWTFEKRQRLVALFHQNEMTLHYGGGIQT
jgi:hypothetical protein